MYILEKYYTDEHDVDEELMAIVSQGGRWHEGNRAGIALRSLNDHPTTTSGFWGASRLKK